MLGLGIKEYLAQLLHAFDKLSKLSYVKKKPNYNILIIGAKALLTTFKYSKKLLELIFNYIFRLGVLFKKLKFFTTDYTEAELIQIVKRAIRDKRNMKIFKTSPF